ncbi:MAG TPA: tripartite tricarboxylate transporter TctB family protein [Burkholderiales bacterium]|nr:tripartite tricarboxylate transporter TctB family protein [Burkholderiales bacterium]
MNLEWRTNKDLWAGLMYIGTGAIGMWIARDYPFGSALRMGPGYFPTVLGGIMIAMGIYVLVLGLRKDHEKIVGNWSIRALIILPVATVVFGLLMEHAGFIPAMLALIPVSALAGREFKWIEVVPLTIGLLIVCTAGFIYGLGLPYPLIKGLWGY